MDQEQKEMVQRWIEEAVAPLREKLDQLEEIVAKIDANYASEEHYHDDYASVDHVSTLDESLSNRLSRLDNDLSNLEYRVNDVDRKAERAQSTADNASRGQRGYW